MLLQGKKGQKEPSVETKDTWILAGVRLHSRLLLGSSGHANQHVMLQSIHAAKAEVVTVSIRRISLQRYQDSPLENLRKHFRILPNTAGCETVKDAVLTAELARESLETNWIKLEVIGDRYTLYPDMDAVLQASVILTKKGFFVLPYCTDDPIFCQRLQDVGCAAIMPLGAPIGTGLGILNPYAIETIVKRCSIPVILDAGIGTASDATKAMEMGCDAVLLNSAVARSREPIAMAGAFKHAVRAGRLAFTSGRMTKKYHAVASSPQIGLIGE